MIGYALLAVLIAAAAGVKIWDYFHGRHMLTEIAQEISLMRQPLSELDAFCRRNPNRSDAVVSLTSLPSRLPLIHDTIKSLLRQTRAPAEIRLYLPRFSTREQKPYAVPPELRALKSLTICESPEDYGPATKFLPALRALPPDRKLVVVDDDRVFQPNMLQMLDDAANTEPDAAYGLGGWIVPDDLVDRVTTALMFIRNVPPAQVRPSRIAKRTEIDILMGAHAYLVRPRFFDLGKLADFSAAPPAAFFADDIWISAHCRVPKYTLPSRLVDFQPYRHVLEFDRSSIGFINRVGAPEHWKNTLTLKYFGREPWRVGAGKRGA